jgi:tryptophanyl-tRNA synthetase
VRVSTTGSRDSFSAGCIGLLPKTLWLLILLPEKSCRKGESCLTHTTRRRSMISLPSAAMMPTSGGGRARAVPRPSSASEVNQRIMRVLSGIQPSGRLHLGNYFGAMRPQLEMQAQHECFYFIANYHALTSLTDRRLIEEYSREVALGYLSLGLEPQRTVFFRQSDVPEVTELAWILSCVTPLGLLQRAHSYKDKVAQGLSPHHGLFAYPVLQAADILIYKPQLVPVGQDQKQHVEMTQDMQGKFNQAFGEVLVRPEPLIREEVAVVPGVDGRKMSKSYDNTIELFAPEKEVRKRIMGIVTDSTPVEEPKDPDKCNVMALLRLTAPREEVASWEQRYRHGGTGYGEAKKRLFELFIEVLGPARQRYQELSQRPQEVEQILAEGGRRARAVAQETMRQVREACGLITSRSSG